MWASLTGKETDMPVEFTLRGLLSACFRQGWMLLILLLTIPLAGFVYITVTDPVYEAGGSLLIKFGHDMASEITHTADGAMVISQDDRREMMQSNIDILQSKTLLTSLVKEIGVENIYPGITERSGNADLAQEEAIKKLEKSDLTIKADPQSNIINIKMQNRDPQVVSLLAMRLMEMFMKRQSEIYAKPQTNFLQEQIKQSSAKLEQSQQQLKDFKAKNGVSSIEEELAELLRQKGDTSTMSLESVDSAWDKLSELQSQETQLLTIYRPDSPQVQHLHESVVLAQKQLQHRKGELQSRTGGAVKQIDKRIALLERLRGEYNDLVRQVEIDEKNYNNLQQRNEEARLGDVLSRKNITSVVPVDEPTAPVKPVHPRKFMIMAISLLSALVLSFLVVLVRETLDQRFRSPEQMLLTLGVPVMACFNRNPEGSVS
jgi:tyrosine-protein kinase Etk/Wzc